MAKNKLLSSSGDVLSNVNLDNVPIIGQVAEFQSVPKITGVKPCGSQVLVELLTVQELAGTRIAMSDKTDLKVPMQGYVRATGPGFKSDDWGFKIGDRVLISGGCILAPVYDDTHRDRFFMEPHAIKSVLVE